MHLFMLLNWIIAWESFSKFFDGFHSNILFIHSLCTVICMRSFWLQFIFGLSQSGLSFRLTAFELSWIQAILGIDQLGLTLELIDFG